METATRGRSPGKMVAGLWVVAEDGGPGTVPPGAAPRRRPCSSRSGCSPVGPPVICSLVSAKGKRLGDIFAGTVVRRGAPAVDQRAAIFERQRQARRPRAARYSRPARQGPSPRRSRWQHRYGGFCGPRYRPNKGGLRRRARRAILPSKGAGVEEQLDHGMRVSAIGRCCPATANLFVAPLRSARLAHLHCRSGIST